MERIEKKQTNYLFIGPLITSIVAIVLLILTDFAGWYNSGYYVESWGYIGFYLETPFVILLLVMVAALLGYGTIVSLKILINPTTTVTEREINNSFLTSLLAFGIITIGAVVFLVVMLLDEPSEWWFDAGFYGGFLGSGLTTLLFYIIKKNSQFE